MEHRHLNPTSDRPSLAMIDDIISRGKMADWLALRDAARADPTLLASIQQVCTAYVGDPYAQRYHFWQQYVDRNQATSGQAPSMGEGVVRSSALAARPA